MAELQLFTTKYSPFGQRVQLALTEKKIPFELILVDLANKPEALLKANPIYQKVPTIIHNGKPVAESLVILEYLEDAFPDHAPLLPKDAYERSQVRFWIDYTSQLFLAIMDSFKTKPGSPEKQAASEKILTSLKTLDSAIASYSPEGPFFTGDKFTSVDVVLAPLTGAFVLLEKMAGLVIPGPDDLPRLHKWIETTRSHPNASSIVPPGEDTLAHLKAAFVKRAAAAASQ